ncbi:MAG: hypothetical protein M1158_00540 [Candidatus Marsarchaeota archaeon]|nr:hypothetical protein [Candidatus Marsarchaeota archaeon]
MQAAISESPRHSIRLDYGEHARTTMLWEPINKDYALETTFDAQGAILNQKLVRLNGHTIRDMVSDFIESSGIESRESVYEEVRLGARCPKCGSPELRRSAQSASSPDNVPVMPMYVCQACGAKSYYLTDSYLKELVRHNKALFEPKELEELDGNEERFIKEIREYISRMFASKKILSIKL